MGLFYRKVPAVIPQSRLRRASSLWQGSLRRAAAVNAHGSLLRIVTAPPVPGIGGLPKAPLAKGGCLGLPRRGDSVAKATDFFPIPYSLFPKKPFHIGFLGMISACCKIPQSRLRRASSLWQGSLFVPGIVTAV